MEKRPPKLVVAPRLEHAEYFAREVMLWGRSEWKYVSSPEKLQGMQYVFIFKVVAPRHRFGSHGDEEKYEQILQILASRHNVRINIYVLK